MSTGRGQMRIVRVFVWRDNRPDERDELRSFDIAPHVTYGGAAFELRTWDIRYSQGQERITDAFYDEVVDKDTTWQQAEGL